jgi:hypothetical protein
MMLRKGSSLGGGYVTRVCLTVLALGAATACEHVGIGGGGEARHSFVDPFGETPDTTRIVVGSRIDLVYGDAPVHEGTAAEQRERAHAIAGSAWRGIGASHSVDTVHVAFSDRHFGLGSSSQHWTGYYFPREELEGEARP